MLKPIGSLHNVPAPSAAVLGESLKLLATFGDKKAISPLLEQMHDVQAKNEQVFREAQALMGELSVKQKELDDGRIAFANAKAQEDLAIKKRAEALSQAEASLSGEKAIFAKEQFSASLSFGDMESGLADRERRVTERELKCEEKDSDLDRLISATEKKASVLRALEQQLQAKENKLRAALEG